MSNLRPTKNGWEDKKRPMHRADVSISKKPKLDVRVLSSRNPPSPRKDTSPKGFRRSISLPTTSRDSPSPTDELVLSAVMAAEAAEREAQKEDALSKVAGKSGGARRMLDQPSTSKGPALAKQAAGNNGSSGFEKLFCEEIDEVLVEELLLAASQVDPLPAAAPPPPLSQAYDLFSKGVGAHSSILEPSSSKKAPVKAPTALRPSTGPISAFRAPQNPGQPRVTPPAATSSFNKVDQNRNQQSAKPQPVPKSNVITEENARTAASGAESEIRRLELQLESLNAQMKKMKEAQNSKDGEAAMLRFQVNEIKNNLTQQKASHAQAIAAANTQFNEKLKELQKQNDILRCKLEVQTMEARTARDRAKLLETTNARVRLVEPQSPQTSTSHNSARSPHTNRRTSAFLNRSTFEEVDHGPTSASKGSSKSPLKDKSKHLSGTKKSEADEQRVRLGITERTAGSCLALRLAGWERIDADDSDDSSSIHSSRRKEYDPASSLDLLKISQAKKRRVLCERDRPGLETCMTTLRTIFLWPEQSLESSAVQPLLRQVLVECCGVIHYKLILLKDCDDDVDEKTFNERDAEIIERGGDIFDLNEEHDLLDDRPWYKDERGISIRRALGLLSELANASVFASAVLTGSQSSSQSPLERHHFTQLPDFKEDCLPKVDSIRDREKSDKGEPMEGVVVGSRSDGDSTAPGESPSDHRQRFWFIEVLVDLCHTIVRQRRTIRFNGVLVALAKFLRNCALNSGIIEEARPIILRIIRNFLLARPSYYALRVLLDLLEKLAKYEDLMSGFCSYADDDETVEDLNNGLRYFGKDACLLELLCAQLNSAGQNKWFLAVPAVRWLLAVFAQTVSPPRWLVPFGANDGSDGTITCCHRVVGTAILLIYDTFQILLDLIEREDSLTMAEIQRKEIVRKVLQRAVILLHTEADYDLFKYMDRVEGLYDVLIPSINTLLHQLKMAKSVEACFSALVKLEEEDNVSTACDARADDLTFEGFLAAGEKTILSAYISKDLADGKV